jgi:hypothetical protein
LSSTPYFGYHDLQRSAVIREYAAGADGKTANEHRFSKAALQSSRRASSFGLVCAHLVFARRPVLLSRTYLLRSLLALRLAVLLDFCSAGGFAYVVDFFWYPTLESYCLFPDRLYWCQ